MAFCISVRYSRSLKPRLSKNSTDKLTLYGEDPVKGVVGPGQLRRGSYQGENKKGFLSVGFLTIHGFQSWDLRA